MEASTETHWVGTVFVLVLVLAALAPALFRRKNRFLGRLHCEMQARWSYVLGIAFLYIVTYPYTHVYCFSNSTAQTTSKAFVETLLSIAPYVKTLVICAASWLGLGFAGCIDCEEFHPVQVWRGGAKVWVPWLRSTIGTIMLLIVASAAKGVIAEIAGEKPVGAAQTTSTLSPWMGLVIMFNSAGIAEEVLHRLLMLSALWLLMRKRRHAVVASAIIFAAYHLTPINPLYLEFWECPISQSVGSFLSGIVLGNLYTQKGFEAAVVSHTLVNWLLTLSFSS